MASQLKDSFSKRKGLGAFTKNSLSLHSRSSEDGEKTEKKKIGKKSSIFHLGAQNPADPTEDETLSPMDTGRAALSKSSSGSRPRTLQKGRPASVFGSLGKKSVNTLDEEGDDDTVPSSPVTSEKEPRPIYRSQPSGGKTVLLSGEVQTTTGLFRKKKEYLVLTDTHFIRFKTQGKASEAFPSAIPPINGRQMTTRHPSTASIGSMQDLQSLNSHASAESDNAIPLKQIVAAYKVEDGKPFYTTDVVYLDEEHGSCGSIQLMLNDPKEADLWHTSIRGAAQKARLLAGQPYPEKVVSYLVRLVESAMDYDSENFRIFRVVRRPPSKTGKASSDDLKLLNSNMSYMVIGINKLHLISLPDFSETSVKHMDAKASKQSYGLVTLVSMDVRYSDDTFELGFRMPLQDPVILDLAAASAPEIATLIHRSIVFLKPQWLDYTFLYGGPPEILDDSSCPVVLGDEFGWFDRTLVAYCLGYNCNPARIRYTVDFEAEDAPEFRLLPPESSLGYSILELLAVLRSLRFNETFRSISFSGVNMQCLYGLVDTHGKDHVAWAARSGMSLRTISSAGIDPSGRSLLYQELQAIALKANRLRRIDLSHTLPKRRVRETFDEDGAGDRDPGCEVTAAILPLCRAMATGVDWLIFNGIELGETDLEDLTLALSTHNNHSQAYFRAIEVSRCGLTDRALLLFLNAIEHQRGIECLNLSENPGRLQLERFSIVVSRFSKLRRLDLSRVSCTSGPEPLFAAEVMLSWRLEELVLTGFPVNEQTLDSISAYLASEMSDSLYRLQMDQCNMTGAHVALLMRSMCREPGKARVLRLHVSANRLEKGNSDIVKAIEDNMTPTHLTMRMVEYGTESRFRQLLQALRKNTTIRSLDISKASLPNDASDETCQALQSLFEDNSTLEELDISGEHAHLEIARFGIGLSDALSGLKKNRALKVLKIEYQNLGLHGANTLASVLEENRTLQHIWCEHNGITLQGFTVLVNALAKNFAVLYLPPMLDDQKEAVRNISATIGESRLAAARQDGGMMKHSVRRTLTTFGVKVKEDSSFTTPQDIEQGILLLNSKWSKEIDRLEAFVSRNYRIMSGEDTEDMYGEDGEHVLLQHMRPTTAMSDSGLMDHVISNRTPRVELGNPVDELAENQKRLSELDIAGTGGEDADASASRPLPIQETANLPGYTSNSRDYELGPVVVGSIGSDDFASSAAIGRAFELGAVDSSPSETEASSIKS